ncbi:hypothetical protein PVNG_06267 [Plasmodium vivax North Korean]|uniref:Variable surface protein n=1 Tax=Plasmodium vivax North Korean TaxID=1035514 RepID=A0A0J9TLD9_PLAVI|nr:hypothetical protein PVNG_06267 [Plasmodium vivax North Korean]
MNNVVYGDAELHKDTCMKLMRNLAHRSVIRQEYEIPRYHCNILFHWLYNSYNEGKITYNIIDKCFEMYDDYSKIKENADMKCHYHKDHIFYEPTKITLLDIFNDNTDTIKGILKGVNLPMGSLGKKYICESIKIYKYMNDKYCDNGKGKNKYYESTCLKLNNFRQIYEYIYNDQVGSIFKIPSLDNIDSECSDKPPSRGEKVSLALRPGVQGIPQYGEDLGEGDTDTDDPSTGRLHGPLVNEDNSMKKSITTTIGTVAGASSLLALLYKVNQKFI